MSNVCYIPLVRLGRLFYPAHIWVDTPTCDVTKVQGSADFKSFVSALSPQLGGVREGGIPGPPVPAGGGGLPRLEGVGGLQRRDALRQGHPSGEYDPRGLRPLMVNESPSSRTLVLKWAYAAL